ncbi:MAG: ATP-binding protein [Chloroflexota bacterium]
MKCRKCGGKASVNMRQHKLALCREHYLEWLPEQAERFIKKYAMFTRDERLLVAVSGGKDSLALWDILARLDYQADGLYIGLGINGPSLASEGRGYSAESQRLVQKFAHERNLTLHVVEVEKEYGQSIPALADLTRRGKGRPCSVCGLVKRHVMNRIARDLGYAVLATGHNLDDEAAVLLGNTLTWSGDYLLRQGPVLPASPGLARKVKPLCRFYEREMAAYALLRGIEYIYDECPYATGSTTIYNKELLNRLESQRPGAKLYFYLRFLQAREEGLFRNEEAGPPVQLNPCPACGQPTSAPGLCSFCRLVERVTSADDDSSLGS